jgi:cytochrome c-type biogenesis protein CcmH/NrfF
MSRTKTYALVMALLASAALSTACTRTDATGPSDQQEQPSFETLGANN